MPLINFCIDCISVFGKGVFGFFLFIIFFILLFFFLKIFLGKSKNHVSEVRR